MITISARWNDKELGRVLCIDRMFDPGFAPADHAEVLDYGRAEFDRMFAELVRAREMELAKGAAPAVRMFPVRAPADHNGPPSVPFEMMLQHERRILSSYGRSVAEMAVAGGLRWTQIAEVLEDWPAGCLAASEADAREAVLDYVQKFKDLSQGFPSRASHLRVVQ